MKEGCTRKNRNLVDARVTYLRQLAQLFESLTLLMQEVKRIAYHNKKLRARSSSAMGHNRDSHHRGSAVALSASGQMKQPGLNPVFETTIQGITSALKSLKVRNIFHVLLYFRLCVNFAFFSTTGPQRTCELR